MSNKIIILTGEIQTGKTTLLQQFCNQKNDIAGILTPIVKGKRMFYNIAANNFFEMEAYEEEEKLLVGKYQFSLPAFTKANSILVNAIKLTCINYLIVDEIGPLETRQLKGLYNAFKEIASSIYSYTLIVVVRHSMVDEVVATFKLSNIQLMTIAQMQTYFDAGNKTKE